MIIIPMAGLSSRFFKQGYTKPKYQLELHDKSVFTHSVNSFKSFFNQQKIVFVIRDIFETKSFINNELSKIGVTNFEVIVLDAETRGQAETVYLACRNYTEDCPITIFNIDTFRHNYAQPSFIDQCDGYLEVFEAEGEHWSFVEPLDKENVLRTTEKERVSNLCSDGLYYFKSKNTFEKIFLDAVENDETVKGEFYVAPLYNKLIHSGGVVKYEKIDTSKIDFCGTPEEYEYLVTNISEA